jgi:hypothetical protein
MTILLLLLTLAAVAPPPPCQPEFAPLDTGTSSSETDLNHWRKEGWLVGRKKLGRVDAPEYDACACGADRPAARRQRRRL